MGINCHAQQTGLAYRPSAALCLRASCQSTKCNPATSLLPGPCKATRHRQSSAASHTSDAAFGRGVMVSPFWKIFRTGSRAWRRGAGICLASLQPPSGVLVASPDEASLHDTMAAVRSVWPIEGAVVGMVPTVSGKGLTAGCQLALHPLDAGSWRLEGTLEDAVTCALDPTKGLLARLGFAPALCIVGISREPSLGEDADHSRTVAAAKRAAVIGVPTMAVCIPSSSPNLSLRPAQTALTDLLHRVLPLLSSTQGAVESQHLGPYNCPRAHFPFPVNGRWSALGSEQLPVDSGLQRRLSAEGSSEYATADCWSLGGMGIPSGSVPGGDMAGATAAAADATPESRRHILRDAFLQADLFICVHVPPKFSLDSHQPFSSTRPGVLWHQEQVEAAGASTFEGSDVWGRSLPRQSLGDAQPSSEGAVFVPQLNTAKVIDRTRGGGWPQAGGAALPQAFVIGKGTSLMDNSPGGDVDAVFSGAASVTTMQTWPQAHALSLLDHVMVEALRQDGMGRPLWLSDPQV